MNERINELAEQARDYADDCFPRFSNVKGWNVLYTEKFAELIVKECLTIIQYEANGYAEPVWAYEIVNDIKERFDMASHLE